MTGDNALPARSSRVAWTSPETSGVQDGCPHCGEDFNVVFSTMDLELASPDDGEWCIWRGYFFVHEELRYPGQSPELG